MIVLIYFFFRVRGYSFVLSGLISLCFQCVEPRWVLSRFTQYPAGCACNSLLNRGSDCQLLGVSLNVCTPWWLHAPGVPEFDAGLSDGNIFVLQNAYSGFATLAFRSVARRDSSHFTYSGRCHTWFKKGKICRE